MSTLKVNKLRDTAGSADAITLDPNGGAVLAGVTTVTSVKVGAAVTISESGIEASGIGITCANINGTQIGGRRNIIINGDMTVAQRGTPTTASSYTTAGYGACDRWKLEANNTDEADFVISQESDAPTGSGFSRSLKIKTNTIENTLDSNEIFHVSQPIEAQNLQHLKNGSSSALPITLSFWVKSYQTGTYVVTVYKPDNTNRQISATYTISASNTWEFKTMTFPGDTSGSGINNDNGIGFQIYWLLAAGSGFTGTTNTSWANYADGGFANGQTVNIFSSTSNYFYLTGVQLEIGTQATPFEHRSFAEELTLCQRYCEVILEGESDGAYMANSVAYTTNQLYAIFRFKVEKRVSPTLYHTTGTNYYINYRDNSGIGFNEFNGISWPNVRACAVYNSSTSFTSGQAGLLGSSNSNALVYLTAEL